MSNLNPKTDWERLEMFEVLAAEYFSAKEALDFPSLGQVIAPDPRTYWLQQMQGMMLRKFFAANDNVQLSKVAKSLRACAVPTAADKVDQVAGWIEWQFEQAASNESVSFRAKLSEGGDDAFNDMIYGRLLHAEAPKFRRTQLCLPRPAPSRSFS
ncbi:hypothetical protein AHiyo6_02330 [Arthrobacter sp. Hiyo6]|nr:hypothetical protein AHiyo6_02330 [Arthrobacter sp. Hiyo6]